MEKTITALKRKGFGFIKIELEGDLNRHDTSGECSECDGSGEISHTDGDGGWDWETCTACDGSGDANGIWIDRIRQQLSDRANNGIVFDRFSYDGTVDSEYTVTIPVDLADTLPEFIKAFKNLRIHTDYFSRGDAGLHVSVMQHGEYGRGSLDPVKRANFTKQMTRLLPALYFHASSDHQTRDLTYRKPQISERDKYSAVHYFSGGIEFRVFEPCFDRPEAILDYVQTIAKCLRYYSKTVQAPKTFKRFTFHEVSKLREYYMTSDNMKALNATVALIAPDGKDLATLKKERQLEVNQRTIARLEAKESVRYSDYLIEADGECRYRIKRELEHVASIRKSTAGMLELNNEALKQFIGKKRKQFKEQIMTKQDWLALQRRRSDSGWTVEI